MKTAIEAYQRDARKLLSVPPKQMRRQSRMVGIETLCASRDLARDYGLIHTQAYLQAEIDRREHNTQG